jgi:hypothetical protein
MNIKLFPLFVLLLLGAGGCGSDDPGKPVPNKVTTIGDNVEPASYITVLEGMAGADREKYLAEHKEELDKVMAQATPEEKERLESVRKLP